MPVLEFVFSMLRQIAGGPFLRFSRRFLERHLESDVAMRAARPKSPNRDGNTRRVENTPQTGTDPFDDAATSSLVRAAVLSSRPDARCDRPHAQQPSVSVLLSIAGMARQRHGRIPGHRQIVMDGSVVRSPHPYARIVHRYRPDGWIGVRCGVPLAAP
jgi:hypothetical protein